MSGKSLVECYKQLRKVQKEEADLVITDILNRMESSREITLYRALDTVRWIGDDSLWIQVYEYGIKKKIKPRGSLRTEYEARKNPN